MEAYSKGEAILRKEPIAENRTLGNGLSAGDQKVDRGENQQDVKVLVPVHKEESKIPTRIGPKHWHVCSAVTPITGLGHRLGGSLSFVKVAAVSWLSPD